MQKILIGRERCSCLLWSNNFLYWCIYLLFRASPFKVAPLKVHGSNISSCTIAGQMFRGPAPFWTLQVQPAVFLDCDYVTKYSHISTA